MIEEKPTSRIYSLETHPCDLLAQILVSRMFLSNAHTEHMKVFLGVAFLRVGDFLSMHLPQQQIFADFARCEFLFK